MTIKLIYSRCPHCLMIGLLLFLPFLCHAEDFLLEDIQGKTHKLSDYRGKWVLVNFWATWCPPCLDEIPELNSLHNAHRKKDLVVIGIAMSSGSKYKVADFADAHGINYPVVIGNRRVASQIGIVDALPTTYIYSPSGDLVNRFAGEMTRSGIEKYIKNNKIN